MNDIYDMTFWSRIIFSIICGFIIGLERQIRGKTTGIRTCILICLGTMLFIYLSLSLEGGRETARVLGQVVTGIGFLGAGVIITRGDVVSGVTSASVVWLLAGIGAAIGFKRYDVAVVMTFVAFSVLVGVEWLEEVWKELRQGVHRRKGDTDDS